MRGVEFKDQDAKQLFLRYAIPCGSVLVKRKKITQHVLDRLERKIINQENVEDNLREIFTFGINSLKILAMSEKKKYIDEALIHKYFWELHPTVVLDRNSVKKDIPVRSCFVTPGIVTSINDNVKVNTLLGEKSCKSFIKVNVGDYVTTHYNYVCERITADRFKKIEKILRPFLRNTENNTENNTEKNE